MLVTQVPVLLGCFRGHLLGHLGWGDAKSIPRKQYKRSLDWAGFTAWCPWYSYKEILGSNCCSLLLSVPAAWEGAAGW